MNTRTLTVNTGEVLEDPVPGPGLAAHNSDVNTSDYRPDAEPT